VSTAALRNSQPIGDQLHELLSRNARVLEIASGTGQHGAYMCERRADITWQYSDIDPEYLAHQSTLVSENHGRENFGTLAPPLILDMTSPSGWQDLAQTFDAVYCANMIHIAPWEAALGLVQCASHVVKDGGTVIVYGPFLLDANSAPSNLDFDRSLKSRDTRWGVRNLASVKHIFADQGLELTAKIDMPRDNYLLVFR
jgi:SAM-dependent methyltransferase